MRHLNKIIKKTEAILPDMANKTDEELKVLFSPDADLSLLQAILSEVCFRTTTLRPYREQLLCVLALFFGYATDMKTGEGKSLVAALCAVLHALYNRRVHIATVNDYLASRDKKMWEPFFCFFSLKAETNHREHPDKKAMYEADILYSASSELVFDYLRNELNRGTPILLDCVIIDEMDFVLLDNANSLFSVSAELGQNINPYPFIWAKEFSKLLKGYKKEKDFREDEEESESENFHYIYSPHEKTIHLTDRGFDLFEQVFPDISLYFYKVLINTLEAVHFYQRGADYLVLEGRVELINPYNGRLMPNSQLETGLHTAIEIKENLSVTEKPSLCNSMSYQQFFIKYKSMTGMSGTLLDAKDELKTLFNKSILPIPPHKKNIRLDLDTVFFQKKEEKYQHLLNLLKMQPSTSQPFLVVAESEEEAFFVHNVLLSLYPKAILLSAEATDKEDEIISRAGSVGAITISTNLVGRGADIIVDAEAETIGGLFVVCLNHYTSRRIDNQVRGRAARQGARGTCVFLSSLEDEIFWHLDKRDIPTKNSINRLQNYLDGRFADTRKKLFEMESVLEKLKEQMFLWKKDVVNFLPIDTQEKITELGGEEIAHLLYVEIIELVAFKQWLAFKKDMEAMREYIFNYRLPEQQIIPEYIRNCFREFEVFKCNVLEQASNLFKVAQRKN